MRPSLHASRGFTLIEVVIVTALLVMLLAMIIVFLDPVGRILNAQLAQSETSARSIEKALELYSLDTKREPAGGSIPEGYEQRAYICAYGASVMEDCIDLDDLVDLGYLNALPRMNPFPSEAPEHTTGFTVYREGKSYGVELP